MEEGLVSKYMAPLRSREWCESTTITLSHIKVRYSIRMNYDTHLPSTFDYSLFIILDL
jgi:hypothetical protein